MPFIRTLLVFLCVGGVGTGMSSAGPESGRKAVKTLYSVESEKLPVLFRSPQAVENPSRLALCEKALLQMAGRLGLSGWNRTRFEITWNEEIPNSVWVDTFPRNIHQDEKGWVFLIKGQGNWKDGQEQFYRTLAICLLQSRMLPQKGKMPSASLPDPPLWLSEGLTQIRMESRREDFASAVWRFCLAKKVPSLEAIQDWSELSDDGIRRSWQQAFSFWLLTQSSRTAADKATLLNYLEGFLKEPEKKYWTPEAGNEDWWQHSTSLALKQDVPGYDWEQSVARLRESTFSSVKYLGDEGERLISIIELPKSTASLQSLKPIDEMRRKLADLELNAHPLIGPVATYYRKALESWTAGDIDAYALNLRAARDWQKEVTLMREKANDFLDWFMVNHELDVDHVDYRNYAKRMEELEESRKNFREQQRIRTDPKGVKQASR